MYTNNYRRFFEAYFTGKYPKDVVTHRGNTVDVSEGTKKRGWCYSPFIINRVSLPASTPLSMSSNIGWGYSKGTSANLTSLFNDEKLDAIYLLTVPFIVFGSGNTAATRSDYRIEHPITTSLTYNIEYFTGLDSSGHPYWSETLLINNSGSKSPITIRELGVYIPLVDININDYGSYIDTARINANQIALIEHTVLDSPVTLQYLESGSINYKITSNVKIENVIE